MGDDPAIQFLLQRPRECGETSERRYEYERAKERGTSERARSEEAMEVPSTACPPTHRVRGRERRGHSHITSAMRGGGVA